MEPEVEQGQLDRTYQLFLAAAATLPSNIVHSEPPITVALLVTLIAIPTLRISLAMFVIKESSETISYTGSLVVLLSPPTP